MTTTTPTPTSTTAGRTTKGAKRTKAKKATTATKPSDPAPANTPAKPMGLLDAALKVLKQARKPMTCRAIVDRVLAKKLWQTTGKTPAATLNAAIHREIRSKGDEARFVKAERGHFAAA